MSIRLRDVVPSDLEIFFAHQCDREGAALAAFPPRTRDDFFAHWEKIGRDPSVRNRTIIHDGQVAGYVASFEREGATEICYWIDRALWGKGIATAAVAAFLEETSTRPIHARIALGNVASMRVVERCGFVAIGEDRYTNRAGEVVDERVFVLRT